MAQQTEGGSEAAPPWASSCSTPAFPGSLATSATPAPSRSRCATRSSTGREISYIARTAMPFFLLMCFMVVLLVMFPELATWLPETMREAPS